MQVSEGVLGTNFFFNGPWSQKNRTSKIIATQKCLNTFTGYFLDLKLSWKSIFFSYIIIWCLLMRKNPWTYFLKISYVKNIYFEKISGFLAPFSAAVITAAGDNFLNFFFTFWKITSSTTNVASFRGGSRGKIFFK